MKNQRQFVYRYNGDPATEETELDLYGEIPVPNKGDVVERNGRRWKVIEVITEQLASNPPAVPVCRVFLGSAE